MTCNLRSKLQGNPHFPTDEMDLVPLEFTTSFEKWCELPGTLNLVIFERTSGVRRMLDQAKAHAINMECVCLSFAPPTSEKWKAELASLARLFRKGCTTHTLMLCPELSTPSAIRDIISLNCPYLARLVAAYPLPSFILPLTPSCSSLELDAATLAAIQGNPYLEHLPAGRVIFDPSAAAQVLAGKSQRTISFEPELIALHLPSAAAARSVALAPLNDLLSEVEFSALPPDEAVGLRCLPGAAIVPLPRSAVSKFRKVQQMIEDQAEDSQPAERVIPVSIEDPPVSIKALSLAVHLVTHYVPLSVQKESEEMEDLGPDDPKFTSYTWCREFDHFLEVHLQPDYGSVRLFHLLCEMMAIAAYLEAPALKRFVRAALLKNHKYSDSIRDEEEEPDEKEEEEEFGGFTGEEEEFDGFTGEEEDDRKELGLYSDSEPEDE